jgi:quinoprotein glucose dehydrogenase
MRFAAISAALIFAAGVGAIAGPMDGKHSHAASEPAKKNTADWPVYGGTAENNHFSSLQQINRSNVRQLAVAWTFDTGESGGLQTSPIVVDGVLYGLTPSQKVFALNAATGKPIPSFGKDGRIDLRDDLGRDPAAQSIYMTSPAVIYKDLVIVGGREAETLPASPGDVRAYDVRTGKLRWSFHTIPHPGEFGYDTWPKEAWKTSGAANNWSGMTVDIARGIVFVPTGSAAFDFYGADRVGDNLFANCLIALNAQTGERIWHFQGVKHDLWDRDFPAPPVLLTVERDGKKIGAVAQTTKQGFVFLFDRTNGKPLFPIECRNYPPSDVPGEVAAQQQCLPAKPAPFARQLLTENLLSDRTPEVHQWALEKFRSFRSEGQFVPFSVGGNKDTVIFPGFDGGAEWGGAAADPETGILYVNANDVAWTGALAENTSENTPKALYLNQCAVCHGEKMAGSPPAIPSLVGVASRMSSADVAATIKNGKGRMPGFANLENDSDQWYGLLSYVMSGGKSDAKSEKPEKEMASSEPAPPAMKYHFTGYHKFLDPESYPAVAPPWGTLNAINLNTGEYVWKIPLGEYPELAAKGQKTTGTENYGGPVVTAGGLVFIGATNFDKKFRAFDKATGALLWESTLPFSGNATPATYEVDGRQFVAIGAGGGKDPKSKSGGVYVAFALKK